LRADYERLARNWRLIAHRLELDETLERRAVDAETAKYELSQRLANIVNSSDDAIVSKDLNGRINSWNTHLRIFG
jgi:PAS domain-containing protein